MFLLMRLSEGIKLAAEDWDRHRVSLERFLREGLTALEEAFARIQKTLEGLR